MRNQLGSQKRRPGSETVCKLRLTRKLLKVSRSCCEPLLPSELLKAHVLLQSLEFDALEGALFLQRIFGGYPDKREQQSSELRTAACLIIAHKECGEPA